MLTDYYVVRKRHYDVAELYRPKGLYWGTGGFHIIGLVAWVIGAIAYELVHNGVPSLGGGVVCFVVSSISYWAISTITGKLRPGGTDATARDGRPSPAAASPRTSSIQIGDAS